MFSAGSFISCLDESRVLVTGGAGLIGSAIVWALNQRGCHNVVVTDHLGSGEKWRHLGALRFRDYLEADDLLPRLRSGALGTFDVVLHLGACSSTTERDVTYLVKNNFEYSKEIASWALAHDARFVYASSAATYGDGGRGMRDEACDLNELRPLNAYGFSKHVFDRYASSHGFFERIAGLKYFNVFGPNEDHKGDMRSMVRKAWEQVRDSGRIQLFRSYHPEYRDGEQQRDFLYVKDAAAMTLHVACRNDATGLFNIGSGRAHTWLDVARSVFGAMGREPKIDFVEMPSAIRSAYQYFTQADIRKLRATGYSASVTPLNEAVRDYVTNYLIPGRVLEPELPGAERPPTAP